MDIADSLNNIKDIKKKSNTGIEISSVLFGNSENKMNDYDLLVESTNISNNTKTRAASQNLCTCSFTPSADTKYFCPLCEMSVTSKYEFILHIRWHNKDKIIPENIFTCCICAKLLSSSSNLDYHILTHIGVRAFHCKNCQKSITANINMHGPMWNNFQKTGENDESDGKTDISSSNNKLIDKRNKRKFDCFNNNNDYKGNNRRSMKNLHNGKANEMSLQMFQCLVCNRTDFMSLNVLHTHMENSHSFYEMHCTTSNVSFKNNRALDLHKHIVHSTGTTNNIINKTNKNSLKEFNDVSYVGRYEYEKNEPSPLTVQKFMQNHQEGCLKNMNTFNRPESPAKLSKITKVLDVANCRDNCFSYGNLQNKSALPFYVSEENEKFFDKTHRNQRETYPVTDTKDLADVQSNSNFLQHLCIIPSSELLQPPENIETTEQPREEERKDAFLAELRKMKSDKKYPCRLCKAIFPNLRALKSHNITHMFGREPTSLFQCNVCLYSLFGKEALIRHMATHNVEKSYECSLCKFLFTTKSNCQRHLRTQHGNITKEEIKKACIYHQPEVPTNTAINKLSTAHSETEYSVVNNANADKSYTTDRGTAFNIKQCITPEIRNMRLAQAQGITLRNPISKELSVNLKIPNNISPDLKIGNSRKTMPLSYRQERSQVLNEELLVGDIQEKNISELKQFPNYDTHSVYEDINNISSRFQKYPKLIESPMDLSMNILDLKSKKHSTELKNVHEPEGFPKTILESSPALSANTTADQSLIAQQQVRKNRSFYNRPPSPYYSSNLPRNPEMGERMLQLQRSGETISDKFSPLTRTGIQTLHQQTRPNIPEMKYLQSPKTQPKTSDLYQNSDSVNMVNMVTKGEIFIPKQLRYRTERPFSCEHCFARFTLCASMNEHIKDHHPQYCSRPQHTGLTDIGKKPCSTPPSVVQGICKQQYYDSNIPNYDIATMQESKETIDKYTEMNRNDTVPVKYDVLGPLKAYSLDPSYFSPEKEELFVDDEDDALIIDEEYCDEKLMEQEPGNNSGEIKSENPKLKTLDMNVQEVLKKTELKTEKYEDKNLLKLTTENGEQNLVPVSTLLDNTVSWQLFFEQYLRKRAEANEVEGVCEEN